LELKKSNQIYQQRINRVIDHVNNNLGKSISLDELASIAFFSPFHFHRIFVAVTGESVNFFTNRVRLEKAARLIKFSKSTIAEIAMNCGFSSPSTLSRSFKQYFGIAPSVYRNNGKIENSKICKELFPVSQYLEPMSEEELVTAFPVKIKELPARRIAYIRVVDSYREGVVIEAFGQMVEWAKKMNLYETQSFFGMSIDDPMITPKEKYRYEVCMTLPDSFEINNQSPMDTMILPACKYAMTTAVGEFNRVATAISYLFNNWLVNSDYEPEHQHGLEVFLDKEKVCDWSYFNLELYIPVKKLHPF